MQFRSFNTKSHLLHFFAIFSSLNKFYSHLPWIEANYYYLEANSIYVLSPLNNFLFSVTISSGPPDNIQCKDTKENHE